MAVYDNWKRIAQKLELAVSKKDERLEFYSADDTKDFKNSRQVKSNITICVQQNVNEFIRLLSRQDLTVALDLETTGLDPRKDIIVSVAISFEEEGEVKSYFIDQYYLNVYLLAKLKTFLYNNIVVFHNAKFDLMFLDKAGIPIDRIEIRDSMLSAYIAYAGRKVSLKHLSGEILGFYYDSFEVMSKGRNILDIPINELAQYNCNDTIATLKLEQHFSILRTPEEERVYHLELKVCKILCKMEMCGIKVNQSLLVQLESDYHSILADMEAKANELCPSINLKSSKQLQEAIYIRLGVSTEGIKLGKTGYSTAEEAIQRALLNSITTAQKKFLELLLEYRKATKICSTYVVGLLERVQDDSRIRTNFNQALTATGRLSSSKPNLQNVPKDSREAFIASEGMKLVAIDYSQCEVRILAHFTQDPTLLRAFKEDLDPHLEVAKQLLKKENVSKEERRICKTINFGIIYGMDAVKLAMMSGYSVPEAQGFLKEYWKSFPQVADWMSSIYIDVILKGYTETLLGRKRHFEFFNQTLVNSLRTRLARADSFSERVKILNYYMDQFSEYERKILREAGNAPIQGSNADITKLAMIATEKEIHLNGFKANLLLQIHDELVWEVDKKQVGEFIDVMQRAMVSVIKLDVPLKTDAVFANNWKETK